NVEHVVGDRLGVPQLALVDQRGHPGPAALAVALVGIEVEQPELGAVGFVHRVNGDVRVPHGQVGALLEGQAVELVGGVEHAVLQHAGDLDRKSTRLNSSHVKISYA